MIAIRNMGFNSVHKDGINIERPEGGMRYLLLLVKSPAYFEFTKEQFQKNITALSGTELPLEEDFFTDEEARHPGLIRQYVEKPAFIIYTPGIPQYYYHDVEYINDWIVFEGDEVADFLTELNIPLNTLTMLYHHAEITGMIRDLMQEYHQTGSHHEKIMDAMLRTILYKYSDIYHLETRLSDKLKQHRAAFSQIRNSIYSSGNYQKTVPELAEELSLSVSYFQHIYKELFGVPVKQDLIGSRIERARYLLSIDVDSVASIAEMCGYENVEHFIRQFKSLTGMTPSQYKDKYNRR